MTSDEPPSELYKAVKINTDSDTISRAKAIDAIMDDLNDVGVLDAEDINTVFQMLPPAQPEQLEQCPIYGGMCAYPSDQCYDCPRHAGAKIESEVAE